MALAQYLEAKDTSEWLFALSVSMEFLRAEDSTIFLSAWFRQVRNPSFGPSPGSPAPGQRKGRGDTKFLDI